MFFSLMPIIFRSTCVCLICTGLGDRCMFVCTFAYVLTSIFIVHRTILGEMYICTSVTFVYL